VIIIPHYFAVHFLTAVLLLLSVLAHVDLVTVGSSERR
jgi:hypothetical protein